MRARPIILVLGGVLLAALPGSLHGQESPRRSAAMELLELMQMDSMVVQGALTAIDAQIRGMPAMEGYRDVMETFMRETLAWEHVGPPLADLYAETYSEAELREIILFYRTPTGQRLLETQSELMARGAAIGEAQVQARQAVLERRIRQRASELERKGQRP
jgi:uncharacterized protein